MKKDAVTCYELTILDESDKINVTKLTADCHNSLEKTILQVGLINVLLAI